ncbi:ferredoxin [Streptomyces afghaniensis]|uniref:ferredoxin n=1 Tax=Streptomyces TaxID=1883 RepID=UPI001FB00E89|nr:ferredoxin [Streptomyces sp. HP-A2021]UOB10480.1 ferredoxin [Streptomyces sp. HP-A2021]
MKISVDTEKCCGAGQCVLVAPEIFDQDEDGIVILLDPAPSDDLRDAVQDAMAICPADVIQVE